MMSGSQTACHTAEIKPNLNLGHPCIGSGPEAKGFQAPFSNKARNLLFFIRMDFLAPGYALIYFRVVGRWLCQLLQLMLCVKKNKKIKYLGAISSAVNQKSYYQLTQFYQCFVILGWKALHITTLSLFHAVCQDLSLALQYAPLNTVNCMCLALLN